VGLSSSGPELPLAVDQPACGFLSRIIALVGSAVSWLTLAMVLVTFFVVICRYVFNLGWIWLQDSIVYLHACVFMLAAAWTLQRDEHVRVDIFYRDKSPKHKALVNLLGTAVFLLPFCIFLIYTSWSYVATSWAIQEGSREASGLPWVYQLKSLIIIMPGLLIVQGGLLIWSSWKTLRS
jgi:TRAP-type mannitol/chloroaromatic compound transport system permease small subunit